MKGSYYPNQAKREFLQRTIVNVSKMDAQGVGGVIMRSKVLMGWIMKDYNKMQKIFYHTNCY